MGEVLQKITYGTSKAGDVNLVDLGNAWTALAAKTVTGYIVDFVPWRT